MKAVVLYPELMAALARTGMTIKQLSILADIRYNTLVQKISGRSEFTFGETLRIKAALGVDTPLEILFQKV